MQMFKVMVINLVVMGLTGCSFGGMDRGQVQVVSERGMYDFSVDVAKTDEELMQGLMGRDGLAEGEGMWFVFDRPQILSFWMKNMKFPIDIIFVNEDFEVVSFVENVPPCVKDDCESYLSKGNARYVLEVNAGVSEEMGLKTGDRVEFINQ